MPRPAEDPLLISARREAIVVFAIFAAAMVYSVLYSSWHGYGRELEDLTFVFGFPDWVFWGVVVPWGAATLASFLFGLLFMRDERLGDDPDEAGELDLEG